MTHTVSMPSRTVFRCSTCRYFDRTFCGHTMARRERTDLREGECSFWRSLSFLPHDWRAGVHCDGHPLYG